MKRNAMNDLVKWKNDKNRKPLLVYGARQVGKTYLIKEFGKEYFDDVIYVNFENKNLYDDIFANDLSPENIIKELEILFMKKISKDKTLIFFDEIQKNPRALTSLKYFCEDAREYHVIGAGSLLGIYINREGASFPVGKVDVLTLYPMSFDEFLLNSNHELLVQEIKEHFESNEEMPVSLHKQAIDLYNDYIIIGGMPEVVQTYINEGSLVSAIEYQSKIINSYRSDITNYCGNATDANKIIDTFDSIPIQLAKENKKFQYKLIQKGGTSQIFGESISWLVNAGIVNKCIKSKVGVPLKMYEELDSFKLYMNDVGLLVRLSEMPAYLIKNMENANASMLGMITENYVASSLKTNGVNLNYWKSDYDSEIDFLIQSEKGNIIPLEVKKGTNNKSKSLGVYMDLYNPEYAIRVSLKNFGFNNNIKSVPLYAMFCINSKSIDEICSNFK